MSTLQLLRTLVLPLALSVPTLVMAQHGGARGFHAGGGHFSGGHYGGGYSGWHGGYHGQGAYHGWNGGYHGGYGGYHGGYGGYWGYPQYGWGYPYYGFGWGFSIGFGWSPYSYWPAYPYGYYYGARTALPDYQRNDSCDYRYSCACPDDRQQNCNSLRPGPQSRRSVPRPYVNSSAGGSMTSKPVPNQTIEPPPPITEDDPRAMVLVANRPPLRRQAQNAIRTLRAMPPAARERWMASGKYDNLSTEEREALKNISDERALTEQTR